MSVSLQHRVKHATPEWQSKLNVSAVGRLLLPLFSVTDLSFIIQTTSPLQMNFILFGRIWEACN